VEHGENADEAAVAREFDDGLGSRLHERGVAVALAGSQGLAELIGTVTVMWK
jgi:hypothetical protein